MTSSAPESRALRSRSRLLLAAAISAGTAILAPREAAAQTAPTAEGFALNRYEPSESGSEWFANDTLDLRGPFRPSIRALGDYGFKPYVLLNPDGSEKKRIVGNQLFVHLSASVVLFNRLRLGINLPIAALQEGSATGGYVNGQLVRAEMKAGVGDLRLGADLRLVGDYGDPFTLALGARIWFPTGNASQYQGDDDVRVGPHLAAAGDIGIFAYAASVGVNYRAHNAPFAGHPLGSELVFSAAAGLRGLDKKLLIGPELYGSTVVSTSDAVFDGRTTPLSLLGSLHYTAGDVRIGVGLGPGLSHAAGTAQFRALASLEYSPQIAKPAPPPEPVAPPAPPPDRDGDGVPDNVDACPEVPGVKTDDPKTNGCPGDKDKDTIVDTEDACIDVPGVRTDDPKTNGCPSDRDKDGVYDTIDACPDVAGVKTDDPKTNGCPSDRDKDGIADQQDACPDEPGPANKDPKKNGCPAAYVKDKQIRITEQVKFRTGKTDIDPVSDPILDAVLKVMTAHPEIEKIRVEGHTDDRGSAAFNKKLSQGRAAAVANWLAKHGVDKKKLANVGWGFEKPLASNDTDEGRAENRRVEFHIEGKADAATDAKPATK